MTTLLLLLGAAFLFSGGLALVLLRHAAKADDVYPPEAAEAPTYERARPLDEVGPFVVAGPDLDRAKQPIGWVNMRLAEMVAADEELTGLRDLNLSAYYVLPEASPEVQR